MSNEAATIANLLGEHEQIRKHLLFISRQVKDWNTEGGNNLKPRSNNIKVLAKKRDSIKPSLSYLDDGLKKHYLLEEKVMASLIGDSLTATIQAEHKDVLTQFGELNFFLLHFNANMVMANRYLLKTVLEDLNRRMEYDADLEETMLELLNNRP